MKGITKGSLYLCYFPIHSGLWAPAAIVTICVVALTLAAVYPGNPNLFSSTHRGVRLVDRKNPQPMDVATVAEVS